MSATPQRTDRDPFAAMLRGAFVPTLAVGPVAVVVAAVVGGAKAALGAFLGFAVAIAFFALGLYVMRKLDSAADRSGSSPARWPCSSAR
jgi:ATP synthase protein I